MASMDESFDGIDVDPYDEYEGWCDTPQPPFSPSPVRPNFSNFRNDRYNNAFGDYRGGYGPGGGFGPPPFMGPPVGPSMSFFMGRGFGPQGPPNRRSPFEEKAYKYLIRCGVPKEHLKNLPRDMLKLIEPQYCGLCAQQFDSFSLSRIHYISKNHLKNQTKWIALQSEGSFTCMGPREVPFKSRELYCELCDVHITSKAHSDSHYAGKPHRSIVEGRKIPRNPLLNQRGMEERLAQLIRREKKHLKNIQEVEKVEVLKEDEKPTQPELYCEICKTSVTCTEQMTMHKNGKRHLSKEKQFILRMMKGDTSISDNKEQDENGDNKEQEDEYEETGDQDGKADETTDQDETGDWGNGQEELWDESTEAIEQK